MAKNEYVTNKPRGIVDLGILLMSEFSKRHKEIYHTLIWGKADKTNEVKPNVQFLLDLTFEWITKSNLKKLVIVYDEDENELIGISKGMTKKIEKYREHMMHEKNEMIEFRFFPVAECDSMGDVIRELHDKRLLRESFLVVQNGFISSKPLNEFIYKHR
ncbi:hypothetical protein A3Q56_01740 [Intoshia linei]|uniref:Uncharacterized protein n=1 Tax=Intoshia linei TaxID=1819745 RepID=A0A177BAN2_9BILA|nr:hypothetical protein A3Q56_01740 [Intoshia linei]